MTPSFMVSKFQVTDQPMSRMDLTDCTGGSLNLTACLTRLLTNLTAWVSECDCGRGGGSLPFRPNGRGFKSRSSRHVGTLGKSFTHSCLWRFGVKLRSSIHAVSVVPLSSSGLEEVL